MKQSGIIVGYDPGGRGKHGLCFLELVKGNIQTVTTHLCLSVDEVISKSLSKGKLIGVGIDCLTYLATGEVGYRPADRHLINSYPEIRNSIVAPNSLYSSMTLNGLSFLYSIKNIFPNIWITETHPKVLYYHFLKEEIKYDSNTSSKLCFAFGVDENFCKKISNPHEIDSFIAALAALKGISNCWKTNLHLAHPLATEIIIKPIGETYYVWP